MYTLSAGNDVQDDSSDTDRNRCEPDFAPLHSHVRIFDILLISVSIFTHIVDVVFDIYLACRYYRSGRVPYFAMTLVFILFPAFVNTAVSIRMYIMDKDNSTLVQGGKRAWLLRLFALLFQLAPLLRYFDMLIYAVKCRRAEQAKDHHRQRTYYKLMLKEDADIALLRLFECFLEAAPQQVLQITILLMDASGDNLDHVLYQLASIISSLGSMAWSLASYQRSIRFAQADKDNISITGSVIMFLWHFLVTVSRILSISMMASVVPYWALVMCTAHWIFMTVWTAVVDEPTFCISTRSGKCGQHGGRLIFSALLGLVYIFIYFTPSEGRTRTKFIIFYSFIFSENCIAIALWIKLCKSLIKDHWYFLCLTILSFVSFVIGILFMVVYYRFFHPKHFSTVTNMSKGTKNVSIQCDN